MFKIFDEDGKIKWSRIALLLATLILVFTSINIFVSYVQMAKGWVEKPAEVLSVENVEAEYEWFYNQQNGILAIKANIDTVDSQLESLVDLHGEDKSKWRMADRDEYSQLLENKTQQVTAYNQKCSAYQARWDNIFHNIVAPGDIPRECELVTN